MSELRRAHIRRLTRCFQMLVVMAVAVIGWCILQPLWSNAFQVSCFTVRGMQTVTDDDLVLSQKMAIVGLAALPDLCWIGGLVQLLFAARSFVREEFFSEAVINRFQRFAWALVLMAVAEIASAPTIVAYLVWLKKIDVPDCWWRYLINGQPLNSLLAAVLILIVARILRIARQLHEESQLTI